MRVVSPGGPADKKPLSAAKGHFNREMRATALGSSAYIENRERGVIEVTAGGVELSN